LIDGDPLTDRHVPADDLGLGEAFADVGEPELASHGAPDYAVRTRSTAATIRSVLGR
jgi:hypothetical protein